MAAVLPLEALKEKFELTAVWDIFEQEERAFIANNRNTDAFETYYRGVYLNFPEIYCNGEKLTYKGESVTQFHTDETLQQVQKVRLEMLGHIHEVCQKYGLQYFMIYVRCLGRFDTRILFHGMMMQTLPCQEQIMKDLFR